MVVQHRAYRTVEIRTCRAQKPWSSTPFPTSDLTGPRSGSLNVCSQVARSSRTYHRPGVRGCDPNFDPGPFRQVAGVVADGPSAERDMDDDVTRWMMRQSRAERVGGPPRLQRRVAAALAVILVLLAAAAMAGSWRQAEIAESMAAESTRADAYQRASYLAALEMGLLQGTLRDPHGEERDALSEVGGELQASLAAMAVHADGYTDANRNLVRIRLGLQPAIDNYLALSDRGTVAAAQEVLENDIEPVYEEFLETLRDEQEDRVEQYGER